MIAAAQATVNNKDQLKRKLKKIDDLWYYIKREIHI